MKVPPNRTTEREGVNAARTLFDHVGWIFQDVDQQNDFGKDAYVEVVQSGVVTPLCLALQIKSGDSYRRPSGDYFIPVGGHGENWRRSTVPVFGIVYDPGDQRLRWADLTGALRKNRESFAVTVPSSAILSEMSLQREFMSAAIEYAAPDRSGIAVNLLSNDAAVQRENLWDAWALGRRDARYLILLRRLLIDLKGDAVRHAIDALSHAADHPNRLGTPINWIPPDVEREVQRTFRWTTPEVTHLLRALDVLEFGYGTLGECLDVLLYCDPDVVPALIGAVSIFLLEGDQDRAVRAVTLALSHSKDARAELAMISERFPALRNTEWFPAIAEEIEHAGRFSIYW
jgi:Domain of unknown function (DUF4365)